MGFVIALVGVLVTGGSAGLAGCAMRRASTPADATRTWAGASGSLDDTETSQYAEQVRRDIEQLQQLQRGADPDQLAEGSPQRPTGPPRIDWTTPNGSSTSEASTPRGVQKPLASDPPASGTSLTDLPLPMPTELPGRSVVNKQVPEVAETDQLGRLIVELSAELYRRGAYSDMPLRELLLIAATTMVTPDRALVPEALPGLTPREREIVGLMQDFFRQLGEDLADRGDPEVLVGAIDELSKLLHKQPQLVLPDAALCSRVGGFGDYDEFPVTDDGRYRFLAQNSQQAVVYVEVEDFSSERNKQGEWVTELSQRLVIFSDRDGIPVWQEDWQLGTDVSKNRREDFFIVQVITLPTRLSVGLYQFKIHVRDKRSGAEAEVTVEFEMVADSRMTK
jgi:hypothetical protein